MIINKEDLNNTDKYNYHLVHLINFIHLNFSKSKIKIYPLFKYIKI
jgi:hypothetical protein